MINKSYIIISIINDNVYVLILLTSPTGSQRAHLSAEED